MARRMRKRLVIDASVARAAGGEDAEHPRAKSSRDFLRAVLDICHQLTVTEEILDEWRRHRSGFARRWQVAMFARRKVASVGDVAQDNLRDAIRSAAASRGDRAAMLKDGHLIEAALAADGIVVSLDDAARALFRIASQEVRDLRGIAWVNPNEAPQDTLEWLRQGAKLDRARHLSLSWKTG